VLLVTGGSGYLGSELLRRRPGALGTFLTQPGPGVELDVRDAAAVRRAFERLRPATVIHTAYRQDDAETTRDGASNVAEAARRTGARLVHLSSDVVFDGEKEGAYTEADEPRPLSAYGRAKAAAEEAIAATHPSALIVRTSLLYGGPRPGPQERLALDADAVFFTDEIRCPVRVGDLAAALLELAEQEVGGVLHLAGADAVDRHEFACLLVRARGLDPGSLRSASLAASGLARPRNCALSSGRAGALLGRELPGARAVLSPAEPPP
jgi:dTDP-4-dehydrorhamnose reductase